MHQVLELREVFISDTARKCLDYHVDGIRLADTLGMRDLISPLGWQDPQKESHFRNMLLRKEPSDFLPGRVPLFVCKECAGYDCAVCTVSITREGDTITWSDFRLERVGDEGEQGNAPLPCPLKHVFDATEYFRALMPRKANANSPDS